MDDELRTEVDKLKRWFLGNGEAGVFQRLSQLEGAQKRLSEQLTVMEAAADKAHAAADRAFEAAEGIREDREKDEAWRKGATWAMGAIVALFGLVGSVAASRILSVLNDLANAP